MVLIMGSVARANITYNKAHEEKPTTARAERGH